MVLDTVPYRYYNKYHENQAPEDAESGFLESDTGKHTLERHRLDA